MPRRIQKAAGKELIVDVLRKQIVDGRYGPNSRLPNRTELISRYQVCSSALQKAQDLLREEGFLHARPRHGTFVTIRPPHLYHVGLVFEQTDLTASPMDRSPFALALAQEATAISSENAWKIVPFFGVHNHSTAPDTKRLIECIRTRRLAGLIVTNPFSVQSILQKANMPCVTFTGSTEPQGMTCIKLDPRSFLERAIERLRAQGRRRVGLIASATLSQPVMSFFHEAADRAGLETSPRWVHGISLRFPLWARHAVRAIMQGSADERPDALIVTDDHLVEATLAGLMDEQRPIPESVEVIAHCNFQGHGQASGLPVRRLGYVVRDLLLLAIDLIHKKSRGENVAALHRMRPLFDHEVPAIETGTSRAAGAPDAPGARMQDA